MSFYVVKKTKQFIYQMKTGGNLMVLETQYDVNTAGVSSPLHVIFIMTHYLRHIDV